MIKINSLMLLSCECSSPHVKLLRRKPNFTVNLHLWLVLQPKLFIDSSCTQHFWPDSRVLGPTEINQDGSSYRTQRMRISSWATQNGVLCSRCFKIAPPPQKKKSV